MTGTDSFNTAHRTGYGDETERTDALIAWLKKHPYATLSSGEALLLFRRIQQLEDKRQQRDTP